MDTVHIRQAAAGGAVSGNNGDGAGGMGGGAMKMGIPAMDSRRTRRLEALLFPEWPQRPLVTLRPEKYAFWVRWPEDIGPVALCFGRGLVDGCWMGCRPGACSLGMERMVVEQSVPGKMGHHRWTSLECPSRLVVPQTGHD